jgi:GAF domain-containing protein
MMAEQPVETINAQVLLDENRRLKHAVQELSILNDLARAIGGSLDPQEIINTIIRRSLRAINAEQGVITLVDQEANDPMKTFVRAMDSSVEHEEFHLTQSLLGWMHLNKKPLLVNSPRTDDRFRGVTLKREEPVLRKMSSDCCRSSQHNQRRWWKTRV